MVVLSSDHSQVNFVTDVGSLEIVVVVRVVDVDEPVFITVGVVGSAYRGG